MREGEGKTALVTGASSGIGKAFAELLAARGYSLVVTARRRDRLDELAEQLHAAHGVATHVIVADLADPGAPARIAGVVRAQGLRIDVLVNNAGYGVPGSYVSVAWPEHQRFIQIMMTAMCDLTYLLLPGMLERGWGRVINIASVAGMVPAPAGHTLYGASKAFVIRFSEALAAENAHKGVHVTAVCPGFTYSEFHDVTGTRQQMNSVPAMLWLNAADVAREGYEAVMRGDAVVVNGRAYRLLLWLMGVVPKGIVKAVSRAAGRRYRKT
ncbi:MAG: SDR family oxidoreductase [Acidobacteriota bacterium]|nr:SDR family oxidoreductase [Acidobacteriota bacterium]